jgi:hypothetical protein
MWQGSGLGGDYEKNLTNKQLGVFNLGWKQGKVNNSLFYVKKIEVAIKKNFDVLEVEILFYTMINMMRIFCFIL